MVPITKFVVEQIRELYTSGLYHKADLAVRFSCYFETPTDILKVLSYEVYPEVLPELRMKVFAMNYIFMIRDEYHDSILSVAIENHSSPLKVTEEELKVVIRDSSKTLEEKLELINKEFGTTFVPFDLKSRII